MKKYTTESFIKKAISIHGNKYDYSLVDYKGINIPIKIKCNRCNSIFIQRPTKHLCGHGYTWCSNKTDLNKIYHNFDEFVAIANKIHSNRYSYLKKDFGINNKVTIYCKRCNVYFKRKISKHLGGKAGCPKCIRQRIKETKLLKYNDPNYSNKEKAKKTLLSKYGVDVPAKNKSILEKMKMTCLRRYGVENYAKHKDYKKKYKKTCLKKYGKEFSTQADSVKAKAQQTYLKHYNVTHPSKVKSIVEKSFETRKRNKTLNTSKSEKQIEILLKNKFIDICTQYKSEKYPFACDFYIPKLDLYIEYQGIWTHGFKPFEGTKEDIDKLNLWKNKNTPFYDTAIKVWTITDPLKRKTAKDNGLNWLEFFNFKDFIIWYDSLDDVA